MEICKTLDPDTYYGMNVLDYLTGNTDRHPENWGFLIDNETNEYIYICIRLWISISVSCLMMILTEQIVRLFCRRR